ncbi:MAG: WYL domain-containing protein [Polyangiaceae bacterium]
MLGLLASRPSWTAPELALELGVSVRTVRRDLVRLAQRGVPLQSEAGRGGGLSVPARTGLGRLQLDVQQTLDLLLAVAVAEHLGSPLMLSTVKSLRQKLAAAFPAEERRRVSGLRQRILVGPTSRNISASWGSPRAHVTRPIQRAFLEQRTLALSYRTEHALTQRLVEPQFLLLSWPAWYLLVWDHLRNAPRTLRVDRIESASVGAESTTFRLRTLDSMNLTLGNVFSAL